MSEILEPAMLDETGKEIVDALHEFKSAMLGGRSLYEPVGTVKFIASDDIDDNWIHCNGSFITDAQYPELTEFLGKHLPDSDQASVLSEGEIEGPITNGVIYEGKLWVYSYSTRILYGIDLEGSEPIKKINVTAQNDNAWGMVYPTEFQPLVLSIVKSPVDDTTKVFLSQLLQDSASLTIYNSSSTVTSIDMSSYVYVSSGILDITAESIEISITIDKIAKSNTSKALVYFSSLRSIPYIYSDVTDGVETFHMTVGAIGGDVHAIHWISNDLVAIADNISLTSTSNNYKFTNQRISFDLKNQYAAYMFYTSSSSSYNSIVYKYTPTGLVSLGSLTYTQMNALQSPTDSLPGPANIYANGKLVMLPSLSQVLIIDTSNVKLSSVKSYDLSLPSTARIFSEGMMYVSSKDIYLIFVGTGFIFSRTLEDNSFGYLDTTSILGTISDFAYVDYDPSTDSLCILGQDSTSVVKAAQIKLNTVFDYSNDGAWLPNISSNGIPAYIKAYDDTILEDFKINVTTSANFNQWYEIFFNEEDDVLLTGTYTRKVRTQGTFRIGARTKVNGNPLKVFLNGTEILQAAAVTSSFDGIAKSTPFKISDFIEDGITITTS